MVSAGITGGGAADIWASDIGGGGGGGIGGGCPAPKLGSCMG